MQQVMQNPGGMNPQALANNLWAAAQLQDAAPEVLQVVPAVVAQIPAKAAEMNRQEVSMCISATMRLADAVPEVFDLLSERLASRGGEDPKPLDWHGVGMCLVKLDQLKVFL